MPMQMQMAGTFVHSMNGESRIVIEGKNDDCIWVHKPAGGTGSPDDGGTCPAPWCKVGTGRYCQFNVCMPYLIFLGGPTIVFEAPDTVYQGCCFSKCEICKFVRAPDVPESLPVATEEPLPVATEEPLPVATAELPVATTAGLPVATAVPLPVAT